MRKISKILSIILTLVMVISIFPMSNITVSAEDIPASGTCGENLTWEFNPSTGTLTISGTGAMDDFIFDKPWEDYKDEMESVIIEDGVTAIGIDAFSYCDNITSVTIPNSVRIVGELAFFYCDNLIDVYYLGTEEEWNNILIWEHNEWLIDAIIHFGEIATPSGTCGESVTWEFDRYKSTLTISGTGSIYNYDYDDSPWVGYKNYIKTIFINDGVTSIGEYAFYECINLENVTIPDGVTTIGDYAFEDCDSLTSITIPDGVTTIGIRAFFGCTSLTSITIPDSVTTIGDCTFYGCDSLTSISIPNSVTTIGDSAFVGCHSLTSITIPNGVTTIGCDAFRSCSSLTSITIPDGVTSIDEYTFAYCSSLTSVTIPDSVTEIGAYAFRDCSSLISVSIPNSVTTIGDYAFEDCDSLTSITIPDSVTTIGKDAFYGCSSLTSITIPNSVTKIGYGIFGNCDNLIEITVDENNQYYSNDEYGVLFNKDKTTLVMYPTGNTRTSYTIPNSVTTIGKLSFHSSCNLTSITIPDGVTTIGDVAFYNCGLESITIPDSVTTIGYVAFYNCSSLTDVYYYGTEKDWNSIFIDEQNDELLNATIHYNYIDPDKFTGIKGDYFYWNDVRLKAYQLVEFEGDYYFINDGHKIAKNKRIYLSQKFVEGTDLKVGYYDFDAEGKMILLNGPVGDYFYKDNVRLKAYQLVEFEGNYYFINDGHKIAKNKRIYLSERFVEGTDLKVGYYEFDSEGKMVYLNGPVGDYFYKDNVRLKAYQLVEFEGDYYFINDSHKLAKNKRIYLSERFVEGTDFKAGYYEFDAEGKMVYLNGPVGDYFYKDNVRLKAYQLVEFEGDYYFINDSHKLAKDKRIYLSQRFVEGTDLKVGWYNFDADGKMIIE